MLTNLDTTSTLPISLTFALTLNNEHLHRFAYNTEQIFLP